MDGLQFSIPMPQLIVATAGVLLCLLLGRHKLGLLIAYFACLYWGYLANMQVLIGVLGGNLVGLILFAGFGMFLAFLGLFFIFSPGR